MTPAEVHLRAYEVLEAVLDAGTGDAAIEPLRAELEVLSREDLIRVASAIAAESVLVLTPARDRTQLQARLVKRRDAVRFGSIVEGL